ncbi:MAG: helix-turn-helix domain-containing protein [Leptospiraceae bacterium]|nr:helix-turn-helix domain-containing protein [Leptospiraceae bacterium]MCP5496675.1 helix-turn-helix domain-containing protein [Leptospiraceae bacterium]
MKKNTFGLWQLLFILILTFFSFLCKSESQSIFTNQKPIQWNTWYILDSENKLSLEDILSPNHPEWSNKGKNIINLGFVNGQVWLKITVFNPNNSVTLLFDPGELMIDLIEFYLVNPKNNLVIKRGKGGLHISSIDWPVSYTRPVFPFQVNKKETVSIYLKIRSTTPFNLPISVLTEATFSEMNVVEQTTKIIYLGMFGFVFIYFLNLLYILKDRLYAYLLLFLTMHCLLFLIPSGSFNFLIQTNSPNRIVFLMFCVISLGGIALNLIVARLFDLKSRIKSVYFYLIFSNYFYFALGVFSFLFIRLGLHLFFIVIISHASFLIFISCVSFFKGGRVTRLIIPLFILAEISLVYHFLVIGNFIKLDFLSLDNHVLKMLITAQSHLIDLFFFAFFFLVSFAHRYQILSIEFQKHQERNDFLKLKIEELKTKMNRWDEKKDVKSKVDSSSVFELDSTEVLLLKEKIEYLFEKEKIYKNENLSLPILARILDTKLHKLSYLLNTHLRKSFWELLTDYRIKGAISMMEEKPDYPILRVAYEVGFESKSAFYRAFRKYTGITPIEYKKTNFS